MSRAPGWCEVVMEQLAILDELAGDEETRHKGTPVSETELSLFEAENGVDLPAEYRELLLHVGAGIGPVYGLLPPRPVSLQRDGEQRRPAVRLPFSLAQAWTPDTDEDDNTSAPPLPAGAHLYDGCLELAEIGCGYFYLLIVTGPARGQVWIDYTEGDGSIAPDAPGVRAWFERWTADEMVALTRAAAQRPEVAKAAIARALPWLERIAAASPDAMPPLEARTHALLCLGERAAAREMIEVIARVEPQRASLPALRALAWSDELERASAPGASVELARHPVVEVRLATAKNPEASRDAMEILADDPDAKVRLALAGNPQASAALLDRMAASAMEKRTPDALLELEVAIRHAAAPPPLVARVADWAESWQEDRLAAVALRAAALAPAAGPEVRRRLADSRYPEVRHGLARNHATRGDELLRLASDPDPVVRAAVAIRRDLPPPRLAEMAADPHPMVRGAAGRNPATPASSLRALAADLTYGVSYDLARNPRLPPEVVAALAVHPSSSDLEPDPAEGPDDELANDGRSSATTAAEVVAALSLGHPSFPVALLGDHYQAHMGAYTMSSRPWLSADQLARLARDSYASTRLGIARRPEIPLEILTELAADPEPMVRAGAALHDRLPAELLARLLDDPSPEVLENAVMNPAAPIEAMARLARHPVNYVRRGVARNPEAPAELIDALAADQDMQPRWWAALHARLAPAALERLAADPDQRVRTAAEFRRRAAGLVARG